MSAKNFWLIALAALIGTAHAPLARAADAVNVVTPSVVIFAIPYWIADRQGYFKDEDIAPTLDIEPNGKRITERLLSGATQFSLVGPDAVLIDATKGGPLRILAGIVRKPPLFLIAKSSIKTFADLRGANIGALSLTEGSSKLLIKMAKAEGVAAADLKISAVGGAPARQAMLKDGKIDAGMQPLPLNLEAEALGFNNLGWAGKYEPDWQFTTVNANGDWALRPLVEGALAVAEDEVHHVRVDVDGRDLHVLGGDVGLRRLHVLDRGFDDRTRRGISSGSATVVTTEVAVSSFRVLGDLLVGELGARSRPSPRREDVRLALEKNGRARWSSTPVLGLDHVGCP